jgi:predicted CxxxxCH...CXXCH cytochrome family protein
MTYISGAGTSSGAPAIYEYTWDSTTLADGPFYINATATDGGVPKTASAAEVSGTVSNGGGGGGLSCSDCHDSPPLDGTRSGSTGAVRGSHGKHYVAWITSSCDTCHTASGAYAASHRNGNIELAASIQGGSYSKPASFSQSTNPTMGTCSNTNCHGQSGTPTWAGSAMTCTSCHKDGGTNQYPIATSVFRSAGAAGAHQKHMTGTTGMMSGGVVCGDCHTAYAAVNDAGHFDTAAPSDVPFPATGDADLNGTATSYTAATKTCTVYCHGANMPNMGAGGNGSASTPAWTATLSGCGTCHGAPPNSSSHSGTETLTDCVSCHPDTVNGAGAISTVANHINGTLEVQADCWSCHGDGVSKAYPPLSKWGTNRSTADGVGAHVKHIEATASMLTKEGAQATTTDKWCAECHTVPAAIGDPGHTDAAYPADITFAGATEAKYGATAASYTPAGGGSAGANDGTGGTCSVYCHGANMPNGSTNGSNRTPNWTATLSGCGTCHGAPPNSGSHTGSETLTQCSGCHPDTVDGTGAIATAANHVNGTVEVTMSCTGCHASGQAGQIVTSSSPHVATTRGGAFNACTDCHPGGGVGSMHSATGVVSIPNKTTAGIDINYVSGVSGGGAYSGYAGIVLGGDATSGTTEAEICWNCHDGLSTPASEWGANTGGTYNYGTVYTTSAKTTQTVKWIGTYWTSANFPYKEGVLNNKPTHASPTTGTANGGSTHGVRRTNFTPTGVDAMADIGCTYCHDVHDTAGGTTGKPYLRGNWLSSPFKEDGAPRSEEGRSWSTYVNRGAVPRAGASLGQTGNNELGGWQTENNNTYARSGNATNHGGLCLSCHTGLNTVWKHGVVVDGLSGGTAANIFDVSKRGTAGGADANTYRYARPHHIGITSTAQTAGGTTWIGGLRGGNYAKNWGMANAPSAGKPEIGGLGSHIATLTGDVVDTNFHRFPCAKCHTPHASRLPRLMITNCLDVAVNSWDDTYDPTTFTADDANVKYTAQQLAYSPTSGNCHRYVKAGDANMETSGQATGTASGWNTVTPWQ